MKTFDINGQIVQGTGGSIAAVRRFFLANEGKAFDTVQVKDDGNVWAPGTRWVMTKGKRVYAAPDGITITGPMSMLSIDGNIVVNLTDTQVVMRNEAFKQTVTYTIV